MVSAQNLDNGLYARIDTSRGEITVRLFYERAPLTVTNFVGLTEGTIDSSRGDDVRFFDGLRFHRVVADFVIQGGDPAGNGTGGPGYTFPDEFHPELRHSGPGVLSMANRGPDTNGSQFFITLAETPWLDDRHAVFGEVIQGMDVVRRVEQGDTMESVEIIRVGRDARRFRADQASFQQLVQEAQAADAAETEAARQQQLTAAEQILPDAEVTDSGIRFAVEQSGSGTRPQRGQTVIAHYEGRFLNGQLFDSSRQRGEPIEFPVGAGRVIQGWDETLLEMQPGEIRTVIIPPELAYGEQGAGGVVPPGAYLWFRIELLEVR